MLHMRLLQGLRLVFHHKHRMQPAINLALYVAVALHRQRSATGDGICDFEVTVREMCWQLRWWMVADVGMDVVDLGWLWLIRWRLWCWGFTLLDAHGG